MSIATQQPLNRSERKLSTATQQPSPSNHNLDQIQRKFSTAKPPSQIAEETKQENQNQNQHHRKVSNAVAPIQPENTISRKSTLKKAEDARRSLSTSVLEEYVAPSPTPIVNNNPNHPHNINNSIEDDETEDEQSPPIEVDENATDRVISNSASLLKSKEDSEESPDEEDEPLDAVLNNNLIENNNNNSGNNNNNDHNNSSSSSNTIQTNINMTGTTTTTTTTVAAADLSPSDSIQTQTTQISSTPEQKS